MHAHTHISKPTDGLLYVDSVSAKSAKSVEFGDNEYVPFLDAVQQVLEAWASDDGYAPLMCSLIARLAVTSKHAP